MSFFWNAFEPLSEPNPSICHSSPAADPFEELSRLINEPPASAAPVQPAAAYAPAPSEEYVQHPQAAVQVSPAPAPVEAQAEPSIGAGALAAHLAAELERGLAEVVAPEVPVAAVPETEEPKVVVPYEVAPEPEAVPAMDFANELDTALADEFEAALQADLEAAAAIETHVANAPVIESLDYVAPMASEVVEPVHAATQGGAVVSPVDPAVLAAVANDDSGSRSSRRWIGAIAAVGVIGLGSAGAYSMLTPAAEVEAPLVVASTAPVKVRPKDEGGTAVMNADNAVFAEQAQAAKQERLVETPRAPVQVAAAAAPQTKRAAPVPARKVRTVVVRPDGTIVTTEAGAEAVVGALPRAAAAPAPAAPEAPSIDERLAQIKTPPVDRPQAAAIRSEAPAPAPVMKAVAKAPEPKPVVAEAKPEPVAKPVEVAAPAASTLKPGGYVVQISAQRSQEGAEKFWTNMKRKFAGIIGARGVDYQRKEIAGKGTYYRVRVVAESKADARGVCSALKKAGGSCFVTR